MLQIGELIDGKYKILNKIGQGGMSVVYLAMNEKANKQWAVKEVRREGVRDFEVVRQGLLMETELLKELNHPNLPSIVDVIETDGMLLIVMDYIEGNTLSTMLEEYGAQPQDSVVEWARQLCDVLDYLHTRTPPIIYRDMKPSNIMIKPDGKVTLIDFGIARKYKEHNLSDTTCLGTRGYAAPEQFAGEQQRQTDARTDIYNLGATLYHLVTGHNPSEPPYEMRPIRSWDSSLSDGLEKIITRCTQKDPKDRYQSCRELLYALEHYTELDDLYRKKQKRRLAAFCAVSFLCLTGLACGFIGLEGLKRQTVDDYNTYLASAGSYEITSMMREDLMPEVVSMYLDAIDLAPDRPEAYLQLLDYYFRMGNGQTGKGLATVTALLSSDKGGIQKNNDILMKIARAYFNGNAKDQEFSADYTKAYQYFSMVDTLAYPEAGYYASLAGSLSVMDVDWQLVLEDLKALEEYNASEKNMQKKAEIYLTLANLYRSNASVLKEYTQEPFTKSIELLEKADGILDDPYSEPSVRDAFEADIVFGLADSHYRKANLFRATGQDGRPHYEKAIQYYTKLLDLLDIENSKLVYENKIADIYRACGDQELAVRQYENLINRYPKDITAYASYGLMLLLDNQDLEKSTEIYQKAKMLDTARNDSNFKSLEQKLKNAGVI